MGSADLLSGNPAARASQQPPVTRELFEQLVRDFDIRLAGLSTSALTDQRNTLREGTQVGNGSRQPTEVERQCLIVGLTLELLQHPGVWNEGAGDLGAADADEDQFALDLDEGPLTEMPEIDEARVAQLREAYQRGELKFDAGKLAALIQRYHGDGR